MPNTRGPHSPTSKWTRERSPVDGMRQPRVVNGVHPEPIPFPVIPPGWTPFQPLFPGQAPGPVPAGMAFRPDQIPFFPAPIGFSGVPYNQISPANHIPQPNMNATFGKQSEIHALHQPKPIHLSPAEQFDASRPFYYNNQWMIAYGNPAHPVGLMPPFPVNMAPVPMQPQPMPVQPRPAPKQPQPGPHPKGNASTHTAGREQGAGSGRAARRQRQWLPPPGLPSVSSVPSVNDLQLSPRSEPDTHKSSILASDITKSHLRILRAKKRQVEDQLQYNIHQIDRKEMESRLKEICDSIDSFESLREKQLQGENGTLPLFQTHIGLPANSTQSDAESNSSAAARHGQQTDDRPVPSRSPGSKAGATITSVENPVLGGQASQRKPSSLPVNAALAPPFRPRAEANNSSLATAAAGEPVLVTHLPQPSHGSAFKSFFHKPVDRNNYGVPYLVGKLPEHIEVKDARDTDREYIRDLNQHELHAIHLYRQRVPVHEQTGVIFDGVNFYYPHSDDETDSPQSSPKNPQDLQPPPSSGENESLNDPFNAMAQAGTSAIRNRLDEATRSESLHRTEDSLRGSSTSELPRSESYVSQPSPRYLEFRRRVNERTRISSENFRAKPSEDSGDEDGNLLFKGRRVMERSARYVNMHYYWVRMALTRE